MSPLLLRLAFWTGLVGFVLSLAVHLATFTSANVPDAAWALHIGVFVAFAPVVLEMKAWAESRGYDFNGFGGQWATLKDLLGLLRRWEKAAFAVLLVYVGVNFFAGVAAVTANSDAGFSYRLFSGHWLWFYAVSTVFARRLLNARDHIPPPHET